MAPSAISNFNKSVRDLNIDSSTQLVRHAVLRDVASAANLYYFRSLSMMRSKVVYIGMRSRWGEGDTRHSNGA